MTKDEIKESLLNKLKEAKMYEEKWRTRANSDIDFFHGDTFNKNQWGTDRINPKLTINKTAQHVLNIENKARQYKMGINVNPYGYGSQNVVAEALEGLIRHIMNRNNSQQNAIMKAIEWQVRAGLGWIEVGTQYVNNDDFDQDFVIKPISDATLVFPDPYVKELDYSDMRYCFIEEHLPKEEFTARYKEDIKEGDTWPEKNDIGKVKIVRGYLKEYSKDTLIAYPMAIGGYKMIYKSQIPENIKSDILREVRENKLKKREILRPTVKEYILYKEKLISEKTTPFKHIPMIPFVGVEHRTEKEVDRYGIVRPLRDPQNMLNIAMSEIVEQVHLQPKARFLTPIQSVSKFLDIWTESNISNRVILPYEATNKLGQPLPVPTRLDPPMVSQGLSEIVKACVTFMEGVTGQTDVQMSESTAIINNAATAEAKERVTQTATYHYTDNQARALKLLGEILLESIPIVYDTKRILECSLDYGFTRQIIIDNDLENASDSKTENGLKNIENTQPVTINPTIGKYNVVGDVGINYQTERQKAFDGIYMLIQTSPALAPQLMPYLLKASDYPLAQEMAQKLLEQPTPELQELNEKIQQLTQQNQILEMENRDKTVDHQIRLSDLRLRQEKQAYEKQIAEMDQETKRRKQSTDAIAAMGSIDPDMVKPVLAETVTQFEKQLASPYGTPAETIGTHLDNLNKTSNYYSNNKPENIKRIPSLNPPGGEIHEANPVIGAIKEN